MKVLIVEDGQLSRKILENFLSRQGYEPESCGDGDTALQMYQQNKYPLIIVDIMMPGMTGIEFCKHIRMLPDGEAPFILILTGHESPQLLQDALDAGADDYLPKADLTQSDNARFFNIRLEIAEKVLESRIERKKAEAGRCEAEEKLRLTNNNLEAANKKLRKNEQKLQTANHTKDSFFSIIAHDLKGPLSVVIGYSEMLSQFSNIISPEDQKEAVDGIHRSGKHLLKLLENLLEWSRSQTGRIQFSPENTDLKFLVDENIVLLMQNAQAKGINLYSTIEEGAFVNVDQHMITTVIRNLISNAIKFTPAGGSIRVAVEPGEKITQISVIDTGIGISKQDIDKLFRLDVHHTTIGTSQEKGTGLGLILCKEFIENHQGKIWVESELGKGTAFNFTVPTGASPY